MVRWKLRKAWNAVEKVRKDTKADYIAFVGSRRKAEKIKEDVIAEGWDADRVAAVHSPAGVHIGAITPDEIALSILSEIVRERRLGSSADALDTVSDDKSSSRGAAAH